MLTRLFVSSLAVAFAIVATPALASEGVARVSGTLRAGPGTEYPRISRIGRGEDLEVHGCLTRYSWCDVTADGERGWFPGQRIDLLMQDRRVRLEGSPGLLGLTILSFGLSSYWDSNYSDRPWYGDRRWNRNGNRTPVPRVIDQPPRRERPSIVMPGPGHQDNNPDRIPPPRVHVPERPGTATPTVPRVPRQTPTVPRPPRVERNVPAPQGIPQARPVAPQMPTTGKREMPPTGLVVCPPGQHCN